MRRLNVVDQPLRIRRSPADVHSQTQRSPTSSPQRQARTQYATRVPIVAQAGALSTTQHNRLANDRLWDVTGRGCSHCSSCEKARLSQELNRHGCGEAQSGQRGRKFKSGLTSDRTNKRHSWKGLEEEGFAGARNQQYRPRCTWWPRDSLWDPIGGVSAIEGFYILQLTDTSIAAHSPGPSPLNWSYVGLDRHAPQVTHRVERVLAKDSLRIERDCHIAGCLRNQSIEQHDISLSLGDGRIEILAVRRPRYAASDHD
jgi:hypothetical protein